VTEHVELPGTARDDFAVANVSTFHEREPLAKWLRLSRILSEIWRESESDPSDAGTESLMKFVRRDILVCSEMLSLDLPG
jgi:hypothetical protein